MWFPHGMLIARFRHKKCPQQRYEHDMSGQQARYITV